MSRKKIDLTGQPYGKLVVIEEAGRDKQGRGLWRCRCSCGNEITARSDALRSENTSSCGCYQKERAAECLVERNTTHGMARTRLYRIWTGMLTRTGIHKCANEKLKRDYIDRGITVCEEWLIFENFRDWALAHGYNDSLELDREDNDKGYCPENCRWITHKENINNRRNTLLLDDGTPLAKFCAKVGIETYKNGKASKQYCRICQMYRTKGVAHPELLAKANEYLTLLRRLKASLNLLVEVREFAHGCNIHNSKTTADSEAGAFGNSNR